VIEVGCGHHKFTGLANRRRFAHRGVRHSVRGCHEIQDGRMVATKPRSGRHGGFEWRRLCFRDQRPSQGANEVSDSAVWHQSNFSSRAAQKQWTIRLMICVFCLFSGRHIKVGIGLARIRSAISRGPALPWHRPQALASGKACRIQQSANKR
jgi:hypothetical protein